MIELTPSDTINQPRFIQHFFYGTDNKLKALRRKIKNIDDNSFFDFQEGVLIVTTTTIINEKTYQSYKINYNLFQMISELNMMASKF